MLPIVYEPPALDPILAVQLHATGPVLASPGFTTTTAV